MRIFAMSSRSASVMTIDLHCIGILTSQQDTKMDRISYVDSELCSRFFPFKECGKPVGRASTVRSRNLHISDRGGIFTIRSICDKEVQLEIIDTHLDVVLSVYREGGNFPKVKVITMVFNHNVLGRLYMLPVAPLHKVIVRAILSNHERLITRNT